MAYVVRDKFAKRAKKEGLRARSAYKLLDIQKKYRVMKRGDAVLDLGCAPGSWLQIAADIVGPRGFVLGIDSAPTAFLNKTNIVILQKDILDSDVEDVALKRARKKFSVLLSDAAPHTTGVKGADEHHAHELSLRALYIACAVLGKGGNAVIKVFQGPQTPTLLNEAKMHFEHATIVKPMASQKQSKEWYIVAREFQG